MPLEGTLKTTSIPAIIVTDPGVIKFSSGGDIVMKASGVTPKENYVYRQILPHEVGNILPFITNFYEEIGYSEGIENPKVFALQINQEMGRNPYSIIYICEDLQSNLQGYIWFRIDKNPIGQNYIAIEHDYIIPEHRGTLKEARIHRKFIDYVIEIGERCNSQYVNTVVRTEKLEKSRMKLGFKSVEIKMTYRGTAEDFRNDNPSFQKYYKSGEVE